MPFVSVEGIDGSGKTEQVKMLVERLSGAGRRVLQTKEPDGGRLGQEIRSILTRPGRRLSSAEQLLLVSAARYDHVNSLIRPALVEGAWVVSDRFFDSTYAFQVAGSDVELHALFHATQDVVVGATVPDLTIILDLPLEVAVSRRGGRDIEDDPAEATRDFAVIRDGLLTVARTNPERCRVVDGDRPRSAVAEEVWRLVAPLL